MGQSLQLVIRGCSGEFFETLLAGYCSLYALSADRKSAECIKAAAADADAADLVAKGDLSASGASLSALSPASGSFKGLV